MVALVATTHLGNPAKADTTACILPINPMLHLRGEIGRHFVPVAGPMLQQEAMRYAPAKMGDIVPLNGAGTPYRRIYAAVCYSFLADAVDFTLVEKTLKRAIRQAEDEGHKEIAVPFFADAPWADPTRVLPQVALIMQRVSQGTKLSTRVRFMAWTDYLRELLNNAEKTVYVAPEQEPEEEQVAEIATVPKAAKTPEKPAASSASKGGGSRAKKP